MTNEVTARPAATIVLLRDGADGLGGFMVVRHHAIDFASGALVFPGGRVEEDDAALAGDTALCRNPSGLDVDAMAFRIAAIRETFEECGVLFARSDRGTALIDGAALLAGERQYRVPGAEGELSFAGILDAGHFLPAPDLLTHFAHWITPRNQPKRYDTHFFLAETPAEHLAVHDGEEAVDSLWITPRQALAEVVSRRFKLVFATQMNLMKLALYN